MERRERIEECRDQRVMYGCSMECEGKTLNSLANMT